FLEIWDAQAWQTYVEANEENYSQATGVALGEIV
ncbi:MAG: cell division/cell wall cluster transcriptional repressor MraZ, partial [Rhodococcus sp. (in: high G+C Gram-positive bacteria)]